MGLIFRKREVRTVGEKKMTKKQGKEAKKKDYYAGKEVKACDH